MTTTTFNKKINNNVLSRNEKIASLLEHIEKEENLETISKLIAEIINKNSSLDD